MCSKHEIHTLKYTLKCKVGGRVSNPISFCYWKDARGEGGCEKDFLNFAYFYAMNW